MFIPSRVIGAICLASLASGQSTHGLRTNNNNHVPESRQRSLQSECAELPTNLYFHLINQEALLAMHVEGASLAEGANVVYEYLDDGVHDTFRLVSSGFGNYYHIMAQHSNMAITGTLKELK